eukprot:CAMPEP_0171085540 /NCGR_PEP_ID=MMETSP0766_2-20121228/18996_1 /TAXON_ID=439317 /ORGANISM="Gambierdiscus australes, Strain CAWD 149" /LENGTH=386 /DNA_ID=CAMNT_0011543117 /DNA_START=42 /DNA_END=1202 /DNA_ORIENTATION=+
MVDVHKQYKCDSQLHEWCEKGHEEPQAPLWPSIDPHHHIFEKKTEHGADLPAWAAHSFSVRCSILIGYSYDQLAADLARNNVVATVFLECGYGYPGGSMDKMKADPLSSVAETKAIHAIGDKSTVPMAIVAFADLSQGRASVQQAVEAHKHASERFVGIRHPLGWTEHPVISRALEGQPAEVSRSPAFREGMEVLAEHGLSYDTWLFGPNLPELIDLAKACPTTQIICNHVGTPPGQPLAGFSREESMISWRKDMAELAACENVVVKLSGLSMPLCGFGFELLEKPPTSTEMAAAYEPYFAHVLKSFGSERCFFASNFPVDKASGSFTTHWNAFKILAKKLLPGDEQAQRALFYDNAVRIYKLDKPPFNLPPTSLEAEAAKLQSYL